MLTPAEIADLRIAIAHLKSTASHGSHADPDALATAAALQSILDRNYQQQDAETTVEWEVMS